MTRSRLKGNEMNPVCVNCDVEMLCQKNGVRVAPEAVPHHKRSGDQFTCPRCGATVVASLGEAYTDNNSEPDIYVRSE